MLIEIVGALRSILIVNPDDATEDDAPTVATALTTCVPSPTVPSAQVNWPDPLAVHPGPAATPSIVVVTAEPAGAAPLRTGVVDFVIPSELLSPVSVDVVSASPFGAEGGATVVDVVEVVDVVDVVDVVEVVEVVEVVVDMVKDGIVVEVVELDVVVEVTTVVIDPGVAVRAGTYPQPDRTTLFFTVTDPITFDATRTRN